MYAFLAYLLAWSYFVGAALISACGVTALILRGGFLLLEKIMNGRAAWVGEKLRNRAGSVLGLGFTVLFFLTAFLMSVETG